MSYLHRLFGSLFRDTRPDWVKAKEMQFIHALNQLKTLRVHEHGGMSIDVEEVRDQVLASREAYRIFVVNYRQKR